MAGDIEKSGEKQGLKKGKISRDMRVMGWMLYFFAGLAILPALFDLFHIALRGTVSFMREGGGEDMFYGYIFLLLAFYEELIRWCLDVPEDEKLLSVNLEYFAVVWVFLFSIFSVLTVSGALKIMPRFTYIPALISSAGMAAYYISSGLRQLRDKLRSKKRYYFDDLE